MLTTYCPPAETHLEVFRIKIQRVPPVEPIPIITTIIHNKRRVADSLGIQENELHKEKLSGSRQ